MGKFEAQAYGKAEGALVQVTWFVGEIQATAEIAEMVWFNYGDKARTSPVDHIIFDYLHENGHLK